MRLLDGAQRVSLASMSSKIRDEILENALRLGLNERAELAAELLASLDGTPDEDADAAWAAEVERRAERARSGDDPGQPWSVVRDQLRDRFGER
jgi:putative addiction module component (TIGR02574 family)